MKIEKKIDIDGSLNDMQKEAVRYTEGPLLVLAGAGSGKTRVIVHRIAHLVGALGVAPYNILAITFTNKAANELKERTAAFLGPGAGKLWLGTFHSLCSRILRENPWKREELKGFVIYDGGDSASVVKKCLKELNISSERFPPAEVKRRIERLKDRLITPGKFAGGEGLDFFDEKVALVYPMYQSRLREARALDFGDLLMVTVQLLESDGDILKRYQKKFKYVMVDEYQDTNYAQFRLIQLLGGEHRSVCVVGDDDQSIYGWRGANLENILRFEEHFPGARVVKLEENYRSTGTILSVASSVISKNVGRKEKTLWTRRGGGDPITYYIAEDEGAEADYIRRTIQQLVSRGYSYRDVAILYRTNAQSRVIEEGFRAAGVPYQVVGDIQFYQRREIKDLIAYLKVVANIYDSVSLSRIIKVPPRGIGDKTLDAVEYICREDGLPLYSGMEKAMERGLLGKGRGNRLGDFMLLLKGLLDEAGSLDPAAVLSRIVETTGYLDYLRKNDAITAAVRTENVKEFMSSARQFVETQPQPTLQNFLDRLSLISEQDSYDQSLGAVSLMTLHSSKGLEFRAVFIAGMEDGLCPHARSSEDMERLEEERRLCYVGMTRAKERLYLVRARSRTLHGVSVHNQPSPFLFDIPEEHVRVMGDTVLRQRKSGCGETSSVRGRAAMAAEAGGGPFKKGAVVIHPKFGVGAVSGREGEGEGLKLIINFKKFGRKKLMVKYAGLKEV